MKEYVITTNQGAKTVFLVNGGGSFKWWTVHQSMATRLPKKKAEQMAEKLGADLRPIRKD